MEKIPKQIKDTSVEDFRRDAHGFIESVAFFETPLLQFIYQRGTANPDDAVEIFSLINRYGLGTVHIFKDRPSEQEHELVKILTTFLEKRGHENLNERIKLGTQFDTLIRKS